MGDDRDSSRSAGAIVGAVLIVMGGWFLIRTTGLIPAWMLDVWGRAAWPIAIIALGAVLVIASARGGLSFAGPERGARLYKSRDDRWVDGVLGGLGKYLGVDPVILRLAFIILVLAGGGSLVIAYIIMVVVVPREPALP